MAKEKSTIEETEPLTQHEAQTSLSRDSIDTVTTASTTSLVLEGLNAQSRPLPSSSRYRDYDDGFDEESHGPMPGAGKSMDKKTTRVVWILALLCVGGWLLALFSLLSSGAYIHSSQLPHDPHATTSKGSGKQITMDQIMGGAFRAVSHQISWIAGPDGEDGLLLEWGATGKSYLQVEDIRSSTHDVEAAEARVLMRYGVFQVNGKEVHPSKVWPSPDMKHVLVMSEQQHNWRHSYTGKYWIFNVDTQRGEALDVSAPDERIQLASWAPTSDSIVFTRNNNMFLRELSSSKITQITFDGGPELFYGVPDWVYEEEVYSTNTVTWWSEDGKYIAFLRTNETMVPEYPVQYFLSRPSNTVPPEGEENYPEVRQIKYPKAGAPNPVVDLRFYDVAKGDVFEVEIDGGFEDDDRLITEVTWAGPTNVLVREFNRESDYLRLCLVDVAARTGKVARTVDVAEQDGGWVEPTQDTTFIPADPENGRPHDGYIETIAYENYDHMAYFTPLDNPTPKMLTSGKWEVVQAPSAVDLKNNIVYFVSTKESPTQRHIYTVKLDGTDMHAITDTSEIGYYYASFSKGAGYALLGSAGPGIPWQKVISTPSNPDTFENIIEENKVLAKIAAEHELPIKIYQNVTIDGYTLQVVERRPAHFDPKKKYPVLFYLYGGPASQQVDRRFGVDFQSYIAATLGYIVVTVDGRGTGYMGRDARCIIRGNIGHFEAHDQIETAKIWAKKKYVDESRMALWGWSYGGYMTLKTLEQDAGQTFRYGMAVAPVTDWRFYDSVYTERYMHTPQHNPEGYNNASISNMTALGQNVRFLVMHGVADDNVHYQSTLKLIDGLDLAGVENYDVHFFPDSDHSIYFHNANRMVYDRKLYPSISGERDVANIITACRS